jgi:hypothetical protein
MKTSDYEWVDRGKRRELVLVEVMNKPRTAAEAKKLLGYKQANKLDVTFRELRRRGLVKVLGSGLWALSPSGREIRRQLLYKQGRTYSYRQPRLDWKTYLWVVRAGRRKVMVLVLQTVPHIMAKLLSLARGEPHRAKLTREKAYAVMDQLLVRNLAMVQRENPRSRFSLTKDGQKIKDQLLSAWMLMFVFL